MPTYALLENWNVFFLCVPVHYVFGCDGRNRTRNIAVYTWRPDPLSYGHHLLSYSRHRKQSLTWIQILTCK
jgi:hypothetical protein